MHVYLFRFPNREYSQVPFFRKLKQICCPRPPPKALNVRNHPRVTIFGTLVMTVTGYHSILAVIAHARGEEKAQNVTDLPAPSWWQPGCQRKCTLLAIRVNSAILKKSERARSFPSRNSVICNMLEDIRQKATRAHIQNAEQKLQNTMSMMSLLNLMMMMMGKVQDR